MSEYIQRSKYQRTVDERTKTIIKKLKELDEFMYSYGTLPLTGPIDGAIKAMQAIRRQELRKFR